MFNVRGSKFEGREALGLDTAKGRRGAIPMRIAECVLREYRVVLVRDTATNQVVAEIPALSIADFGADMPEALSRLRDMLAFHLECLQEEGKPIPV